MNFLDRENQNEQIKDLPRGLRTVATDSEYDQTAKHVHHFLGNEGCPTCKAVAAIHAPAKTFSGGNEIDLACDVDLGERVDEGNTIGVCPICRDADCVGAMYPALPRSCEPPTSDTGNDADAESPKHVSPSILEFRIKELETENRNVTDLYKQACRDRDAALNRVQQFERFTDILANHLDALQAIAHPAKPRSEFPKAA